MIHSPAEVVEVDGGRVVVEVLLLALEVLALVEVDGVVLVAVGGAGEAGGGGHVVELEVKVLAVVLAPTAEGGVLK